MFRSVILTVVYCRISIVCTNPNHFYSTSDSSWLHFQQSATPCSTVLHCHADRVIVMVDGAWNLNTFLTKQMHLRYLSCIKKFSLPSSASCPVNRNVKDEEYLPLVSVSKGCTSLLLKFRMTFTLTKYSEKSSTHDRDFPLTVRNDFQLLTERL